MKVIIRSHVVYQISDVYRHLLRVDFCVQYTMQTNQGYLWLMLQINMPVWLSMSTSMKACHTLLRVYIVIVCSQLDAVTHHAYWRPRVGIRITSLPYMLWMITAAATNSTHFIYWSMFTFTMCGRHTDGSADCWDT